MLCNHLKNYKMKITKVFTMFSLFLLLPLGACNRDNSETETPVNQTQTPTDLQSEITNFIERRNKAMIEKDINTLSSLMAEDLILVHITGTRQTKQEWLNDIANERMRYFKIETKNLKINKIDDNTATATYQSVITANIYGSQGTWTLNINQKFSKTEKGWLWVNS